MGGLSLRWLPYREAEGGQESREGRQENVDHHRPFGFAFTRHSRLILLQLRESVHVCHDGGRPDDVAAPRQTLSYLTFAGLVNLLARLFRVNQPYQSAY